MADLREGMPDLPADAAAGRLAGRLRSDLRYDQEAAEWTAAAVSGALAVAGEQRARDRIGYCLECHETVAVAPDGLSCAVCGEALVDVRETPGEVESEHIALRSTEPEAKLPGCAASDSSVDAAADSAVEESQLGSGAWMQASGADDDGRQPEEQGTSSPSALSDVVESVWAFWKVCSTVPVSLVSTQSEADPQRSVQGPSGNMTTRDQREFILGIGGAGTDCGHAILQSLLAGPPDSVVAQAASRALRGVRSTQGRVRVEPSAAPSTTANYILQCRRSRQMRELGEIYANPTDRNIAVLRILAGGAGDIAWHAAQLVAAIEGDSSTAADSALCSGASTPGSS